MPTAMDYCLVQWAIPPGTEHAGVEAGGEHVVQLAIDNDDTRDATVVTETDVACDREHGERIKLVLDPSRPRRVRITSTARLAELYVGKAASTSYASTAVGVACPPPRESGDSKASLFYTLEVPVVEGRTELRLAGIKGAFFLTCIEVGPADVDAGAQRPPPHQQTQAAMMSELLALAQQQQQQQQVPEGLQELFGKLSAAPESAQGTVVKQFAAAVARGVMITGGDGSGGGGGGGGSGGGGGGGGGGSGSAAEATAAAAASPAAAGQHEQGRARRAGQKDGDAEDLPTSPPPQQPQLAALEAAIQRSEARILAAVDALARRVGALEVAVQQQALASKV